MADAMNHADSKEFVDRASTQDGKVFANMVFDFLRNVSLGDLTVKRFRDYVNGTEFGLVRDRTFCLNPVFLIWLSA